MWIFYYFVYDNYYNGFCQKLVKSHNNLNTADTCIITRTVIQDRLFSRFGMQQWAYQNFLMEILFKEIGFKVLCNLHITQYFTMQQFKQKMVLFSFINDVVLNENLMIYIYYLKFVPDYLNTTVLQSQLIQIDHWLEYSVTSISVQCDIKNVKSYLLTPRVFLVGYSLSLADIAVYSALRGV